MSECKHIKDKEGSEIVEKIVYETLINGINRMAKENDLYSRLDFNPCGDSPENKKKKK